MPGSRSFISTRSAHDDFLAHNGHATRSDTADASVLDGDDHTGQARHSSRQCGRGTLEGLPATGLDTCFMD
eukprot:4314799-Amphidinium_carterae.1